MIGMQTKYHVIRKKVEKRMKKRTYRLLCVLASTVLLVTGALTGCGGSGKSGVSKGDGTQQTERKRGRRKESSEDRRTEVSEDDAVKICPQVLMFTIIKGGYKLLDVHDDRQYLIVPEGKKKPADLDKDIVVLKTAAGSHLSCGNIGNGTVRFDGWPGQYPDVRRTGFRLVY